MADVVTIKCIKGKLKGREWKFDQVDTLYIGRKASEDYKFINKINIPENPTVSRYHCFLKIDPPYAVIRDAGSLNGTYIDGNVIGKRKKEETAIQGRQKTYEEISLKDGMVIRIGSLAKSEEFLVEIKEDREEFLECIDEMMEEDRQAVEQYAESLEKYESIGQIGEGGFAKVFLAEDKETKEKRAIKILEPSVRTDLQKRRWFMREAGILSQLDHPNIVKTYEALTDGKNFHIVMEYCSRGNVAEYMADHSGKIDFQKAADIILQLLDALEYAHHAAVRVRIGDKTEIVRGVVHRDIKPENLLLTEDGTVKLGDFGLSKAFELAGQTGGNFPTQAGMACGSMEFCSRKQIMNYRYAGPDVDVWSAAAVYYYLLTGKTPREFGEGADRNVEVLKKSVKPIRSREPGIPKPLAKVIDEVLKEENMDLDFPYTTAGELKEKIIKALQELE